MDGYGLVLLGVIALGSLAQVAFFVGLGLSGWRLARRVQGLQTEVTRELRPVLDSVTEVSRNMAAVTDVVAAQVQHLQEALVGGADRLDRARREVRRSLRRPLRSLGAVSAVFRGMRRGLRVYRQLGGLEPQGQGKSRRYRDDEHLFI